MITLIPGISGTAAALQAERTRLEVVSQNIANANTTRGADGKPYQRHHVSFDSALQHHQSADGPSNLQPEFTQIARIEADKRPPRLVFNPHHPDADASGMVAMPDINVHEEMADMIVASRAFEANLAVVKTARSMAVQTLAIGKRS